MQTDDAETAGAAAEETRRRQLEEANAMAQSTEQARNLAQQAAAIAASTAAALPVFPESPSSRGQCGFLAQTPAEKQEEPRANEAASLEG